MAGERILIVDDTPVNLKLTRILLVNHGYEVLTASSAEEALGMLQTNHPRLILTDIHLPGIDGLELTRRIKSDAATHDIPVVAMAAFGGPDEEQEALRAGCDGCISKPVDTRTLGPRVEAFLEQRPAATSESPSGNVLWEDSRLQPLRHRFLEDAVAQVRRWKRELDGGFNPESAAQVTHQWIGTGGLLGYPEISRKAHALHATLRTRPIDIGELREALESLLGSLES